MDGKTKPLKSVLITLIFGANLWLILISQVNISSDILTLDSYCKLYVNKIVQSLITRYSFIMRKSQNQAYVKLNVM